MHLAPAEFVGQAGERDISGLHWMEQLYVPSGSLRRPGEESQAVSLGAWLHQQGLLLDAEGVMMTDARVAGLASDFVALRGPGGGRGLPRNRHALLLSSGHREECAEHRASHLIKSSTLHFA